MFFNLSVTSYPGITSQHVDVCVKMGLRVASPVAFSCEYSSVLEVNLESRQLKRSELQNFQKRVIFIMGAFSAVVDSAAPNASIGADEWGDRARGIGMNEGELHSSF